MFAIISKENYNNDSYYVDNVLDIINHKIKKYLLIVLVNIVKFFSKFNLDIL